MMRKVFVAILFYLLYWLICFLCTGTDKKNLVGLRSYPEAVQQAVRKHPVLGLAAPQKKPVPLILLGNLVLFTVAFTALGFLLKSPFALNVYGSAFWFFLALGEGLNLFDLVVIDLLRWRNTLRIRFSFLQEKAVYQDASEHMLSFWRGIPMFAGVAALVAGIVAML